MVGRRSLLGDGAKRVQGWRERLDSEAPTPKQRFLAHERTLLALAAYVRRAIGGTAEKELWEDAADALREVFDEFTGRLEAGTPAPPGKRGCVPGSPRRVGVHPYARVGMRALPDGDRNVNP